MARLSEVGIPAGKVRTLDDVYTCDQTLSEGLVVDVDHPSVGRGLPGPPLRFDDNTYAGHASNTPPRLGEHNEFVRAWPRTSTMAERLSATELIDRVLDKGSWVSWDTPPPA